MDLKANLSAVLQAKFLLRRVSCFIGSIPIIMLGVAWRDFPVGLALIILGILAASFALVGFVRASAGTLGISLIVFGGFFAIGTVGGYGGSAGGGGFYALTNFAAPFIILAGIIVCLLGIPKRKSEPGQA